MVPALGMNPPALRGSFDVLCFPASKLSLLPSLLALSPYHLRPCGGKSDMQDSETLRAPTGVSHPILWEGAASKCHLVEAM